MAAVYYWLGKIDITPIVKNKNFNFDFKNTYGRVRENVMWKTDFKCLYH